MIATIINAAAVVIGGFLGLLLKGRIADKYTQTVLTAVGLVTLVLGINMALSGSSALLIIPVLVLGGIAGTALKIESAINRCGKALHRALQSGGDGQQFAQSFLDATVLFCIGPMTIIGSMEAGMQGRYEVLLTKSALDGFMAVILAASGGAGTIASALSILLIQGGITLGAEALSPFVTEQTLADIGALGGYMILMIALNLLQLKKISTANFLPSIVLIVVLAWLRAHFGI